MMRCLEYKDDSSSKFWQIELNEQFVDITYGKIGTSGRSVRKDLNDHLNASLYFHKEVNKKLKEGYIDPKVPIFSLESSIYYQNNKPFKHKGRVDGIYYFSSKKQFISYSKNYLYIWSKEGKLIDTFKFHERERFQHIFFREVTATKILVYIRKYNINHMYIFDLANDSFHITLEKEIDVSHDVSNCDIDSDDKYIYIGCSNGLILLDYELNTIKTLLSPLSQDDNEVAINAASNLIAFVQYGGSSVDDETVTIVDINGAFISKFKTKLNGTFGCNISFSNDGTILYTLCTENGEVVVKFWNPKDGTLIKKLVTHSDGGDVISFCLSKDEKWLLIRTSGIGIILWNLAEEKVHWTKLKQELYAHICFADDESIYQSSGNIIYQIHIDNAENQDTIGLTSACTHIFFDDLRQQLWIAGEEKVFCCNMEGVIHYWTNAKIDYLFSSSLGNQQTKLLLAKPIGSHARGYYYAWLNLDNLQETPILTGSFQSIDFNDTLLISIDPSSNVTNLWNHHGNLLKEMKTKLNGKIYLLDKEHFLISKDKKNEIWSMEENKLTLTFKETAKLIKPHAYLPFFLTAADNKISLWDGKSEQPKEQGLLPGEVQEVISEVFMEDFLLIDSIGGIYTLNPLTQEFRQIVNTNSKINKAALSVSGKLFVATEELDVFELQLSQYLNIKQIMLTETTRAASASIRNEVGNEYLFSDMKYSCFSMSSDGKYMAVGTRMSENGSIQIWETASGHCVNVLRSNYGGVGWLDSPFNLQWSPDNTMIGAAINTNEVASINPFGLAPMPLSTAIVTDGWGFPPAWCWMQDSSAFVISCWNNSEIPACICNLSKFRIYQDDAKWFAKSIDTSFLDEDLKDLELDPYLVCHANKEGNLIYGYNKSQIFAIDVKSKQLAWIIEDFTTVEFSPYDDFFLYLNNDTIHIAELNTGKVKEVLPETFTAVGFEFAPNLRRYAAYNENKIIIFDYNKKITEFELSNHLSPQNFYETELRSIRFNNTGDKVVCLLSNGIIEVWSLSESIPVKEVSFESKASGIYWGDVIVAVSETSLEFIKEDPNDYNDL